VPFNRRSSDSYTPEDPEQLYLHLAERNAGPEALWLHQGDVLRSWHSNHATTRDVALELPTGAGKTLVAALIGEYQRLAKKDRVAYLCLTKQLAKQTADRLTEYGISNVLLTGRVRTWNTADRIRYTSGGAIAVSTYAHVFNTNPAFSDADTLLLDDAHGAEGYVASPWSLQIDRGAAFHDIISIIGDALDPLVVRAMQTDSDDRLYNANVYLASPTGIAAAAADLETYLDQAASAEAISDDARYAYRMLEGHIDRCLVYVSYRRLLIRPLIAPTSTHRAFDSPARRVYISATLGNGGELERVFGRRKVARIPVPKGWEKRGTGRRYFCFPELTSDLSSNPAAVNDWVASQISALGRAIVLTPDTRTAENFEARRISNGYPVLSAKDVEEQLSAFTRRDRAALVLSNRYDGIDLPDRDCRLVILDGLPAKGDLQERFLYASLGALEVLQERVRARIVQGAGRATRNARDYAAVVILGDDLVSHLSRVDVQGAMHPEVHAELKFGLEYSFDVTSTDLTEQIEAFIRHDAEWAAVDSEIIADRDRFSRVDPAGSSELQAAAPHEVAAWEAIWQNQWDVALESCRQALDALKGGQAPRRYAALWNYLASWVAMRLFAQTHQKSFQDAAIGYYEAARAAGRGTTWLSYLAAPTDSFSRREIFSVDPLDQLAAENIISRLDTIGRPAKFEPLVTELRAALTGSEPNAYERALVEMGLLAGASKSVGDEGAAAAPDATWMFGSISWLTLEAKSDAKPEGELGARYVREAGSHLRYAANREGAAAPGDSIGVILTPQQRVHPAAIAVAEAHLFLVRPELIVDIFDRVVRSWRRCRAVGPGMDATALIDAFRAEGGLASQWLPSLKLAQVNSLLSATSGHDSIE
jgi:Helicase C-terminal domain/DEAD/DEAH box helicase